ncbi:leucyl aminopeptidase [Patescibacteria group bacterium]|nr:leucyl aminopeptidase [Patescibacteria group bacterium]MBU1755087.1 leucyl aminopeptidase [Patescibacteria group bacterium]
MKLTFSSTHIDKAPAGYTRVRLLQESSSTRRIVREDGIDTLEVGVGTLSTRTFITLCRRIVRTARQQKVKKLAVQFDVTDKILKNLSAVSLEELVSMATQSFEMANFEFNTFKTTPKNGWHEVSEVMFCGTASKGVEAAAKKGHMIGEAVNAARSLSNTPGGDMTPTILAKAAKQAATGLPVTVQVLSRIQMEKLGMGAILAVSKGSVEPPAFIVMEYKGAAGKPIVLAGKGITYDSGGLNLKPGDGHEMHMDMSGGSAVIHTIALAARLKLKKHVVALIPASENMPGTNAMRPNDILKTMSGKTVEVLNTDAEGRLVLADALTYAKKYKPAVVVDVATLTGASLIALGFEASAILTKDDNLASALIEAGEKSGDLGWRLPLWDQHDDMVKSSFADMVNTRAGSKGKYGGTTEGAVFLWQFAKELDCPWAHIDMAPRMTTVSGDELSKGSSGAPVQMLITFIESWK